ncbi:MAG: DUF1727 domain-containing protein [Hydrogenibacillus schlegelii]|uniref:Lipid II isoglutaminyl synthase (glutamine-hydrolyzing) subunit MurT n=1 Tax=Hydrogenibacillus schlegelii TaxID=1484 RepID=A0A947GCP8_HYDSH|nr:DUF1727 domain-containing protein [Hydrogenibacillus schlegelii]
MFGDLGCLAAVWLARRLRRLLLRLRRSASSLPGAVALRLCPNLLARFGRAYAGRIVFVTGTNGKTTTTRLLAGLLRAGGRPVVTNEAGANLLQGVATALIAAGRRPPAEAIAVLEVDEGVFPAAARALRPQAVIVTNLSPDQTDRYGSVEAVAERLRRGLAFVRPEGHVFLNADDPTVWSLREAAEAAGARVHAYGFGRATLGEAAEVRRPNGAAGETIAGAEAAETPAQEADAAAGRVLERGACPRCGAPLPFAAERDGPGDYRCPACGFRRPEPEAAAEAAAVATDGLRFWLRIGDFAAPVRLNAPARYNIPNALAAAHAAHALGVPPAALAAALERLDVTGPGRWERFFLPGDEAATVVLVKNPAGARAALEPLGRDPRRFAVVFVLNDRPADGADVSWIWEVPFERLEGHPGLVAVIAAGERADDAALRFLYAGLGPLLFAAPEPEQAIAEGLRRLAAAGGGELYVLATYTALPAVRAALARRARPPGAPDERRGADVLRA